MVGIIVLHGFTYRLSHIICLYAYMRVRKKAQLLLEHIDE